MIQWTSDENHAPLNPKFSPEQKQDLLSWIGESSQSLRGHVYLLSSGTTAQSTQDLKWVALSKQALLASAHAVNQHLESNKSDCWLHILPEFHVGGIGIWARAYLSGASVFKLDAWNAQKFYATAIDTRATLTSLVPAQVYDLVMAGLQSPKSLRAILVGGGALSQSLYEKAHKLGWPLLTTYGMTETCSQVATSSLKNLHSDAIPLVEVLSHFEVQEGEGGRFQIRGDSLLTEYVYLQKGQPVRVDPKEEGWFLSQDRGEVSGQLLKILGRSGDFIKVGGESVEVGRLREIWEQTFIQSGIQADSALLPVPDERLGHVIHLITDRKISIKSVEGLVMSFNSKVLGFEKIRKWHAVDSIPRTALGKLIPVECLACIKDYI